MKTLDQRPWCPFGWISPNGIVMNRNHVATVLNNDVFNASRETTAIIKRMMQQ